MNPLYIDFFVRSYLHIFALAFVLAGGIIVLLRMFDIDVIDRVKDYNGIAANVLMIVIGLSAVYLMTKPMVYLPFLGETVLPQSLLTEKRPEKYSKEMVVKALPGSTVAYWASDEMEPEEDPRKVRSWMTAYGSYKNAGVVKADMDGNAKIYLDCPQKYQVGNMFKKVLPRHVHYRVSKDWYLSPVYTIMLKDDCMDKTGYEAPVGKMTRKQKAMMNSQMKMGGMNPAMAIPMDIPVTNMDYNDMSNMNMSNMNMTNMANMSGMGGMNEMFMGGGDVTRQQVMTRPMKRNGNNVTMEMAEDGDSSPIGGGGNGYDSSGIPDFS